jgi:5-formyltetrahydrofolate cyclo-ligase
MQYFVSGVLPPSSAQGRLVVMTSIEDQKVALRPLSRQRREQLVPSLRQTLAVDVAALGLGWLGLSAAPHKLIVSGYLPIGTELDPTPLMNRLHLEGFNLCLPTMQGRTEALQFRAWTPNDPLATVQWGIREPVPTATTVMPDVLLIPLLAFDRYGHRLGYGGGYYDRTLALLRQKRRVYAVGLAFGIQEVDAVPHLAYDQKLDGILTENSGQMLG